jgi:hypothetical protein
LTAFNDLEQVKRASARDVPERRQNPVRILFVHRSVADVERCLYELKRVRFTVSADVVVTPEQFASVAHLLRRKPLVSLVSVYGRNLTQTDEIGETVEKGEIVEITNIDAVFMHVAENMLG